MPQAYLEEYKQRLLTINETEAIAYPSLSDYDENFQLKTVSNCQQLEVIRNP
jgi:hypothetical protein